MLNILYVLKIVQDVENCFGYGKLWDVRQNSIQ